MRGLVWKNNSFVGFIEFVRKQKLSTGVLNACGATIVMGLFLYFWRIAYEHTDWAVLSFVPLMVFLFFGHRSLIIAPRKAVLHLAIQERSFLSKVFTGRLWAIFLSGIFVVTAIVILGWHALSAAPMVGLIMLCLVFASGLAFACFKNYLAPHFTEPFVHNWASIVATWVVTVPFMALIASATWAFDVQPGAIQNASLQDALAIVIDQLPERRGAIAELLAFLYAYEGAKLWGVLQVRVDYPLLVILFHLDAALFGFILARSSVVLTHFFSTNLRLGAP